MTDKVQKIRAFLVGIADADGVSNILAKAIEKKILPYIDSLQEEPVSEDYRKARKDATFSINEQKGYAFKLQDMFDAGANWQKRRIVKEIKSRLVDAATNQDNSTTVAEQTYYNGMVDALGRLRDKFMED